MFEGITKSLGDALKKLRGRGRLTAENVKDGLREGEQVVLNPQIDEADVVEAAVPAEMTAIPTATALGEGSPTGAIAASH